MKIHKEGYVTIPVTLLILLGFLSLLWFLIDRNGILMYTFIGASIIFFALVVSFFRFPKREVNNSANEILAPADGKVVVVERVVEKEYFNEERIQVSIFMSPLNVHVNWYPINGSVEYVKYHKGKFLVAWHPKSSELNERSTVVVKHPEHGEILVRQIAGAVARRIRTYSTEGNHIGCGTQFGFIKFGSRVDIFLPLSVELNVKPGDKVEGVTTVLGKFGPN